jgi:hypothetical protein
MAPTLVLIPGSFSTPDMYDPVVLPLRERGHTIHVLDLPCYPNNYKKGTAPPSMMDDAKAISEFVENLVDEKGEDIVLMAHSYGGEFAFLGSVISRTGSPRHRSNRESWRAKGSVPIGSSSRKFDSNVEKPGVPLRALC